MFITSSVTEPGGSNIYLVAVQQARWKTGDYNRLYGEWNFEHGAEMPCQYTRKVYGHLNLRSTVATTHACMHHIFYHNKSECLPHSVLMGVEWFSEDTAIISPKSATILNFHCSENLISKNESTSSLSKCAKFRVRTEFWCLKVIDRWEN